MVETVQAAAADVASIAGEQVADEQFIDVLADLLRADDELLRAEFDAIVAAQWPTSPPGRGTAGPRPGGRPPGRPWSPEDRPGARPGRRGTAAVGPTTRERSPPPSVAGPSAR